jgi:phage gp29-like protein
MQLEMQETASRNGGGALFKEMAEWCDAQTSKAVLGQTMTTDDGSSRSQADVHDRVRMDIARWDARQLENTLNEFLVRPFIQFNYGPQEKYPRVKLAISEPEDLKAFVDALIPWLIVVCGCRNLRSGTSLVWLSRRPARYSRRPTASLPSARHRHSTVSNWRLTVRRTMRLM